MADSVPAINRSLETVRRLAQSHLELYSTFDKLVQAGTQLRDAEPLSLRRSVVAMNIFPDYATEINYAALCLDDEGLSSYGPCTLLLREEFVAHRSSVLEENSVTILVHDHNRNAGTDCIVPGSRATWHMRTKLAVAKLAGTIGPDAQEQEFPSILLSNGRTSLEDNFIEVHIWGPLTIRAFRSVTVRVDSAIDNILAEAMRPALALQGVDMLLMSNAGAP